MLYIIRRFHWVLQVKDILEETCDWIFFCLCWQPRNDVGWDMSFQNLQVTTHEPFHKQCSNFTTNYMVNLPVSQFYSGEMATPEYPLPFEFATYQQASCMWRLQTQTWNFRQCVKVIHVIFLFCTMTNRCTINWQILTLLHVLTLLCHPQGARNLVPCQVTHVCQMQLLVIQFKIKIFHIGFMQVLITVVPISMFKTFKTLKLPSCWAQMILAHFIANRTI